MAQGRLPPNQLSLHLKKALASSAGPRRRLSSVTTPANPQRGRALSVTTSPLLPLDSEPDVVMTTLEQLQLICKHSARCCQRITVNYSVAKALRRSFEAVVCAEEFSVLQDMLHSSVSSRFALAKAFIASSGITTNQNAEFLSMSIVSALHEISNTWQESGVGGSMLTYERDDSGLSELAGLCEEPALLGNKLLSAGNGLAATDSHEHPAGLWLQVELLVQSHDCFTLACNMEGIAAVLRSARRLTDTLHTHGQYTLMICLLTGVGRFSEMKYIFDILKHDEEFDLLLKKGQRGREESLRLALLDYLQQNHPQDSETFTMTALRFTMYREIATMCEKRAHENLRRLRDRPMEHNTEMVGALQKIMTCFADAAENYVKESCYRHAETCVAQARLVALQIQLLTHGSKTLVINLSKPQAVSFIHNHPTFYESYIAEAVYRIGSAWAGGLFNRVIIQSDSKYLADFQNYIKLTPCLISEVAERLKLMPQTSKQSIINMKKLLSLCTDVRIRYRLASELGLTEIQQELMRGPASHYLRDTASA